MDNLEELERLLDRTGKCLDHPKLQVSDRDARALRDRLIATAREVEGLRAALRGMLAVHDMMHVPAGDRVAAWSGAVNAARAVLEGKGG